MESKGACVSRNMRLELRHRINNQAQSEMHQQLCAIRQELGEENPERAEVKLLRQRLNEANLPDEVRREAERELSRMERLPPAAPDYHVIRAYLELLLELPWRRGTEDQLDLARARQVLDADHFNLKDVKERLLEHLGVLKLNPHASRGHPKRWPLRSLSQGQVANYFKTTSIPMPWVRVEGGKSRLYQRRSSG
jgi:ATP-dependent Lon protease